MTWRACTRPWHPGVSETMITVLQLHVQLSELPGVVEVGPGGLKLGWRFRIWKDSVEGRIRADSGGFPAAPQGNFLRWIRTNSVEGRVRVDSWTRNMYSADPGLKLTTSSMVCLTESLCDALVVLPRADLSRP